VNQPRPSQADLSRVLDHLAAGRQGALDRLFQFLAIPSVSTDPAYHEACVAAADWCANSLREIGFQARIEMTPGKPMVVGHWHGSGSPLRVLSYYDVQPPDPLETFLEACRSWIAVHGRLPVDVTILLEGEEESGSPSLPSFLDSCGEELKADICLVCDTGQLDADTPAITAFLRGLAFSEITVTGPSRDLHSGIYGGPARNPIRVLADLLADMHDASGRVTLPGFYDGVVTPRLGQLAQWRALDFDVAAFLGAVGLTTPAGEEGMSVIEQLWSRPTAEINGIFGGYTGPGTKTVIPAHATAKLSFRLVPKQQPAQILDGLHRFIAERVPADCTVAYAGEGGSPAVGFDTSAPIFQAAASALEQEWGKPAVIIGCGASIPIVESFRSRLAMDSLLVGFALDDDRIHAPNEKYNVKSFTKGARSWARLLDELGAIDGNRKA
jgi:acetylornithine deacetylase/succinyl-diaminopimelate desuccinylase-like protein